MMTVLVVIILRIENTFIKCVKLGVDSRKDICSWKFCFDKFYVS